MKIRCLFDIGVYLMAELVVWMCCCFGSHSNIPEMLMIAIETAIDDDDGVSYVPFCSHFFCSSSMFTSSVIVVYLSDEILFPCACARLMHELRWLCVCVCPSVGIAFAFDPFIRSVQFFFLHSPFILMS